ncbi:tyrosine-type recombinase/integrase [Mesorhizobium sp.]|uniref:tyrosine-type recombinase/integrase n=1 Tax=Mesorhizobium sp. TaxID=1871066 RepID=UPI000FE4E65B|nr:tyrosine-type recombinase/integrase [Mesorhizobium sp.]RWE29796.1 MAG: integrase [Mesorhizobium sp.]
MSKSLKESPVTTPNARASLGIGTHWRGIDPEVHLGYRKGKRGGVWLVRWRNGLNYKYVTIGTADDKGSTKVGPLSYEAAIKAARQLVDEHRTQAEAEALGPALKVRDAVEAYIIARDAREAKRAGRDKRSDAGQRLGRYVLGKGERGDEESIPATAALADVDIYSLAESDLSSWRHGLPAAMKTTTRQRLVNDLKAALNTAYAANRAKLPGSLPGVIKQGLRAFHTEEPEAVARDNQILPDADIARVLRAAREVDAEQKWDGDLFRMVLVLTATGARLSQVARMRVADCQIAQGRLMVPTSRKGRGSKSGTITVPVGRDVIDELVPVTAKRSPDALLLERWRHVQVAGKLEWQRDGRGAWRSASELARPWQAIRGRAKLPDVIPYALRHTSIVKGIRANLPIRLVAALHDTSTAMIERHYSKWITSGLEELARTAIVPLVPSEDESNVDHLNA